MSTPLAVTVLIFPSSGGRADGPPALQLALASDGLAGVHLDQEV